VFTLRDIIMNPYVVPKGMSVESATPELNVFYFLHNVPYCGSSFVIPVEEFRVLISEPIPEASLTGSRVCGHHCTTVGDLSACGERCYYAPFRRLLLAMMEEKEVAIDETF
jgi:hypothetical protein